MFLCSAAVGRPTGAEDGRSGKVAGTRSKSSKQALEKTLLEYHNRLIDAKEAIEQMIVINYQMDAEIQPAQELGLSGEEIVFFK